MGNVFFNSKLCLHCQEINWINREKVFKELIMGVIWKHVKPGYITCCIYIYVESVIGCQVRNTKWPLLHDRCIPNSSDKVIFSQAARAQCEWKCLNMESCKYININPSNVSCEMGIGRCMHLEPSAGYMVQAFTISNRLCIQWGSDQQMGREIVHVFDGATRILVSRIRRVSSIIVGKFLIDPGYFFGNSEGHKISAESPDDEIVILTIDEACTWFWLRYTSGEVVPVGAVIGGHLASGSLIYVAKMYHDGGRLLSFGYYSSEDVMGRYEYGGAHTTTTMDILVIL